MYKVALIVPCFERPERTLRALDCVMAQDLNGWEAYFVGDNCPNIQNLIDSGKAHEYINAAKEKGNKLAIFNLPHHYGGFGYQGRNTCVRLCSADYIMFMDNDDVILPNHFSRYYYSISMTDNDFMYFNTLIEPIEHANGTRGLVRDSKIEEGMIGHSEIIVKSSLLKLLSPEKPEYNHDWLWIKSMIDAGAKHEKYVTEPTYIIMSVGELRETNID
jgi:glycosyltransferase involved in cell wall biosynthesis